MKLVFYSVCFVSHKILYGVFVFPIIFTIFFLYFLSAINVMAQVNNMKISENIPMETWNYLSTKRLFFGHQSVGNNIISGIEYLKKENNVNSFKIIHVYKPSVITGHHEKGVLFHKEIGSNFHPITKVNDFSQFIDESIAGGGHIDIAFMKFCFVDIGTKTDIHMLFQYYKNTIHKLKEKYPNVIFVHVTVPILAEKKGLAKWKHKIKGMLKNILGKNDFYENVNKFAYNEMLRKEYTGKEPIFDLAAIESTFPDGKRLIHHESGKNIESMVPAYTSDGGHLSEKGQKIVAAHLLTFIASLERR